MIERNVALLRGDAYVGEGRIFTSMIASRISGKWHHKIYRPTGNKFDKADGNIAANSVQKLGDWTNALGCSRSKRVVSAHRKQLPLQDSTSLAATTGVAFTIHNFRDLYSSIPIVSAQLSNT